MRKTSITALALFAAFIAIVLAGCGSTRAGNAVAGSTAAQSTAAPVTVTPKPTPTVTATVTQAPPSPVAVVPAPTQQAPVTVYQQPTTAYQPEPASPGVFLTQDPSNIVDSTKYVVQGSRSIADSTIGYWIPQLSANQTGMGAMTKFTSLQLSGYSDVFMVWSGEYTSFKYSNYYVIMVPREFSTAAGANAWCDSQGFPADNCFAKRLSHTDGPEGNSVDR